MSMISMMTGIDDDEDYKGSRTQGL